MAELQPLDIVVRVQQKEELAKLTTSAEKATAHIAKLNEQLQKGTINQQQFNAMAASFAQVVTNMTPRVKELESVLGPQAGLGRGLGQLAYAIDDVQYGFNAIVNNIPQIVLGLGYGMGVAGAAGIAAVALNQLSKHWNDFFGSPEMTEAAEKLEKAAEGFKKLAEAHSKWVEESGKQVGERIPNLPGGAHGLEKNLTDALMATGQGEKRESGLSAFFKILTFQKTNNAYAMTAERVRGLLGRLANGDEQARRELALIMGNSPSAFTPEQHQMIKSTDPAALKKAAQEKEDKELTKEAITNQNEQVFRQRDLERGLRRENRMNALQDQAAALREQEHHIRYVAGLRKGDSAQYSSTKAMLADIRQGAFEQGENVGKAQVKRLEAIHLQLKKIDESIRKEQRAGKFG